MKTFLSSFVTLFTLLLIEISILSNWYLLPVVPDLLLITVLFISYANGSMMGQTTGFCSGLMLDFATASPLGLHALLRTIIGFLFGLLHKNINISGIIIPMLMGFLATILKILLLGIISIFYKAGIQTYFTSGGDFLIECVLNALITPIMFKFLSNFLVLQEKNNIGLM